MQFSFYDFQIVDFIDSHTGDDLSSDLNADRTTTFALNVQMGKTSSPYGTFAYVRKCRFNIIRFTLLICA